MSTRCQIILPSSGVIELYDDVDISLNYQIADIRQPNKRHADYSKTITVPGTHNNNKMFQHIFDIGINRWYDPNKKAKCYLVADTSTIMKGFLRLRNIIVNDDKKEYEIEITGRVADLFLAMGDTKIKDLPWADLNHTYNRANQIASWVAPIGSNYLYPFIDYGYSINQIDYNVNHFFPALYIKEIWDRIFMYFGFQYSSSSSFFTSTYFKSLFMPFNSDKLRHSLATINNRRFRASRESTIQSVTHTVPTAAYAATDIIFNDDSTTPNQDTGGVYNSATGVWTCNATGFYNVSFAMEVRGRVTTSAGAAGSYVDFYTYVMLQDLTNTPYQVPIQSPVHKISVTTAATGVNYSALNSSIVAATPSPVYVTSGSQFKVVMQVKSVLVGAPTISSAALEVMVGANFGTAVDPEIKDGDNVTMVDAIDPEMKCSDFVNSIIKMHNIYTEYDKDTPNKLIMDPRPDFYNTTVQDWTQKRDLARDLEITPMGALQAKYYLFTYKKDTDYLNDRYVKEAGGEVYGQRKFTVDNDFLINTEKEELAFSPTPQDSSSGSASQISPVGLNDRYYPIIISVDTNGIAQPKTSNPRILYYGGVKPCKPWNYFTGTASSGVTNYPSCGHMDDFISPTVDLNYGMPRIVYYTPAFNATYTDNNCYNKYWKQEIDEITDKNSSIVTGWFKLTPYDISIMDFRHVYRFDFQNFRLNKIYDYNPLKNGFTKCEFIKMKQGVPFVSNTGPLNGANNNFISGIALPYPSPKGKKGGNSTGTGTSVSSNLVVGSGNLVPYSAQRIMISGDRNSVGENARNVSIINSSGCTVAGDVSEVTIVNSSGVTVTTSNRMYVNNMDIRAQRNTIKKVTASYEVTDDDMYLDVDCTLGAVVLSPQTAGSEKYRGRIVIVKKVDSSANAVTWDGAGTETTDGSSTKSWTVQNDAYVFMSDGTNWKIVGSFNASDSATITNGTYSPNWTTVANITGVSATDLYYQRVGNCVTVWGKIGIGPTLTATSTQIRVDLPIASNFAEESECSGTAFARAIAGMGAAIFADTTNNEANLQFISTDIGTTRDMNFIFQYLIV